MQKTLWGFPIKDITRIRTETGYNRQHTIIADQLVPLHFAGMEHIVLVKVEEEHVRTMVGLHNGIKII